MQNIELQKYLFAINFEQKMLKPSNSINMSYEVIA